jgi:hypothetical protein
MLRDSLNRIADLESCLLACMMSSGAPRSEKPTSGMAETAMLRGKNNWWADRKLCGNGRVIGVHAWSKKPYACL